MNTQQIDKPDFTGIDYPTVEIQGRQCEVRITRGVLYRLSKAGFDLRSLPEIVAGWFPGSDGQHGNIRYDVMIDLAHAILAPQLPGKPTADEIAEMMVPEIYNSFVSAIVVALVKMEPVAGNQTLGTRSAADVQ